MAIVSYGELPQRTGGIASDFKRSYTRVFQVYSDDRADGPLTVAAAVGLAVGNTYTCGNDSDEGSFVQSIEARETGDLLEEGLLWHVTVGYGGIDPTQGGERTSDSPLDKPVEVRYGTAKFERIVDEDVNGDAIVNTVGDPFDPGIVIDDSRPVVQFTRNEATFDAALAYSYRDKVNSATWYGCAPKTWKVNSITAKRDFHGEIGFYWIVDYEFEYRPETWKKRILNQGMRQLKGFLDGPKAQHVKGPDGMPVSQPVNLDADGDPVPPGGTPHWLEFDVYQSTAFSVFNLE